MLPFNLCVPLFLLKFSDCFYCCCSLWLYFYQSKAHHYSFFTGNSPDTSAQSKSWPLLLCFQSTMPFFTVLRTKWFMLTMPAWISSCLVETIWFFSMFILRWGQNIKATSLASCRFLELQFLEFPVEKNISYPG